MAADAPPAYTLHDNQHAQLLRRLHIAAFAEHSALDANAVETERLRNFLLYTLALDYEFAIDVRLKHEDSEHYIHIGNRVLELMRTYPGTPFTHKDVEGSGPYFWKYLHAPCACLDIPIASVVQAICRFIKYRDSQGHDNGCVAGIFQDSSNARLAAKFWYDHMIIAPRLLRHREELANLVNRIKHVSRRYFNSIEGVDGTIAGDLADGRVDEMQQISFVRSTLTREHDAARTRIIERASMIEVSQRFAQDPTPGMASRLKKWIRDTFRLSATSLSSDIEHWKVVHREEQNANVARLHPPVPEYLTLRGRSEYVARQRARRLSDTARALRERRFQPSDAAF